jgi:YihY family inner membrane protein
MAANTAKGNNSGVQQVEQRAEQVEQKARPLLDFWQKVTFDWVPQLSGTLAYTFLTSIIPLMLVIIAISGFILGTFSPGSAQDLVNNIQSALPAGIGKEVVSGALKSLNRSAGLLLIIGVLSALFSGSRLFIAIENCSGVIFRLRGRDPLHQNIMAICMTLLYIALVPITFGASVVPEKLLQLVGLGSQTGFGGVLTHVLGIVASIGVAFVLFAAIFIVVPNRPVTVRESWRGALFTAVLLVVYELIFPVYSALLIKPGNYGSLAGFALVFLAFFYYLSFMLLLGMEINSWLSGQRQTASDIASVIHEVQAHNTTRGAAGPTAGTPVEDQQNHKGARVMQTDASAIQHERVDHHDDVKPPKYAEANKNDAHAADNLNPATPAQAEGRAAPRRQPSTGESHHGVMRMVSGAANRTPRKRTSHPPATYTASSLAEDEPPREHPIRDDVQKVLLAGLVIGTGRLAASAFSHLRHRKQ